MKILTPWFQVNGTGSYPTGVQSIHKEVDFNGSKYWLGTGTAEAPTGTDTLEQYEASLVDKTCITKITKRSFMQRFTQAERIAVRKSTDDIVIDIHEDLKIASCVDLELPETVQGLQYLETVGILAVGRAEEMLVDGTEAEKYRGGI